jgi:hypothetical protein
VVLAALALQGCHDSNEASGSAMSMQPAPMNSVMQNIRAMDGGSVTFPGNTVVATIPAGALSADTTITIEKVSTPTPDLAGTLSANGDIYSVKFSNSAVLGRPMVLKMTAAAAPQHPKVGEIAELQNGMWVRLAANLFRSSDTSVVGLTTDTSSFRVVNRTLQSVTGPGVARGQDVFLNETFGNEAFFKGVYSDPNSDVMTGAGITCALCHVNVAPTAFKLSADGSTTMLPIGQLHELPLIRRIHWTADHADHTHCAGWCVG